MAQVYGQIESLKQIRTTLDQKGIDRFQSTNQIQDFLDNYELEKKDIYNKWERKLDEDIANLKEQDRQNREVLHDLQNQTITGLDAKINLNQQRIDRLNEMHAFFWVIIILIPIAALIMELRIKYLKKNYKRIIDESTIEIDKKIANDDALLHEYTTTRERVLKNFSYQEINKLAYTKEVVLSLNSLIAGAVGENLVVKEINKLSGDFILINDFSQSFYPPIYNRQENDRIFSIQIDHLLISRAGVFILETKNWSKQSVQSLNLRSPIDQIRRTSFALFVLLNNSKQNRIRLNRHHWGSRQIPIRNVIVMINNKPKEVFKHVAIKTLRELNSYLDYFEPIFSQAEVKSIAQYLLYLNDKTSSAYPPPTHSARYPPG